MGNVGIFAKCGQILKMWEMWDHWAPCLWPQIYRIIVMYRVSSRIFQPGGGGSSISVTRGGRGGGENYASTDLIGPVAEGSARLVLQFMAVR